jgi:hypothetical protein
MTDNFIPANMLGQTTIQSVTLVALTIVAKSDNLTTLAVFDQLELRYNGATNESFA